MNWRFIFFLSPISLFMGILIILGTGTPWITFFWAFFSLLASYMLARYIPKKWFVSAIAIGTIWWIFHNTLVAIFLDASAFNLEEFGSLPYKLPVRYWLLLLGPFIGLAAGLLIAIFTWLLF